MWIAPATIVAVLVASVDGALEYSCVHAHSRFFELMHDMLDDCICRLLLLCTHLNKTITYLENMPEKQQILRRSLISELLL